MVALNVRDFYPFYFTVPTVTFLCCSPLLSYHVTKVRFIKENHRGIIWWHARKPKLTCLNTFLIMVYSKFFRFYSMEKYLFLKINYGLKILTHRWFKFPPSNLRYGADCEDTFVHFAMTAVFFTIETESNKIMKNIYYVLLEPPYLQRDVKLVLTKAKKY